MNNKNFINILREEKHRLQKQANDIGSLLALYEDDTPCNIGLFDYFTTEADCEKYLSILRWNNKPICPYCSSNKVNELKGNTKRYKCYDCRNQFSVKVGTIFHDTKISLRKWFVAILLVSIYEKSISSHELARRLNITQKSAWLIKTKITKT